MRPIQPTDQSEKMALPISDTPTNVLPITIVIATKDRSSSLRKTLEYLELQKEMAKESIIVDASTDKRTSEVVEEFATSWPARCSLQYRRATTPGAAPQRNLGVAHSTQRFILLLDDDIHLPPDALSVMCSAIKEPDVLGVTPTYKGDGYSQPGRIGRMVMSLLNGSSLESYAGRVIGPGFTQVPEDSPSLPPLVRIDWMGAGCALYRREALPDPPFPQRFQGASLFEDLCLSLNVGKNGTLLNARTVRAVHAHEGGEHKKGRFRLSRMEIVNRYYIMYEVLRLTRVRDHARFCLMMCYMTAGAFCRPTRWLQLPAHAFGLLTGACDVVREYHLFSKRNR